MFRLYAYPAIGSASWNMVVISGNLGHQKISWGHEKPTMLRDWGQVKEMNLSVDSVVAHANNLRVPMGETNTFQCDADTENLIILWIGRKYNVYILFYRVSKWIFQNKTFEM